MKALKFILAFARILLSLIFAAMACFIGTPAGIVVFALAAILTLPIKFFQKLWGLFGVKKNWLKILIVSLLLCAGLSQIPTNTSNEPTPTDVQPTATPSVEAPEPATSVPTTEPTATPAVTPTATPILAIEPTTEPTPEPTSIPEPTSTPTSAPATNEPAAEEFTYVLNTKSKKFHWPHCSGIKNMSEKNRKEFTGTRDEVLNMEYSACGTCNP